MADILQAASGRWPELLMDLGGLTPDQLSDTHQPCPACGGTDRYRWDRDDAEGGWFCNQCGGKDHQGGAGSGLDLLMRVRSWDLKQALSAVERHLGITGSEPARRIKPGRPHRAPDKPPPGAPPPRLGNAIAQWCYRDAAGEQLFWIQRFDPAPGRKLFIHRVWIDGQWHYPRSRGVDADPFTCEWPSPRPLYRLPDLIIRPDAPVLVVEGEKAADAAAELFPNHVVVSWSNGSKAIRHVDWQPLAGRTCCLWPDNDKQGREAMATLAGRLVGMGCSVAVADYPADSVPEGWDLADANWTPEVAAGALGRVLKEVKVPVSAEVEPVAAAKPAAASINEFSDYFDCLGTDGDAFFYKIHATGVVKRLSPGCHTSTYLVFLAPVEFWESIFPGGRSGVNWTAAASRLAQLQSTAGFYDESRIRSLGAWWDRGRSVLNLGDRLIVDGEEQPIQKPVPESRFIYRGGKPLNGSDGAIPLTDDEALKIALVAEQFLWESDASGPLLAGWATLAPICGVLDWRPHIWLTASAESGKSTVMNRFLAPLLGGMALNVYGQSSEAGIRQTLDSKALAVIFDEAESNERKDKVRMQDVLTLARISSTESQAQMLKGSPDGKSTSYSIRSMFLLCSITTGLKQGADKTRFAQLTLRNPRSLGSERHRKWDELRTNLDEHITPEIGRRLQARTIALIPMIREATKVFVDAASSKFNSRRMGDQYGTLLTGSWSLRCSHVPSLDEALAFIDEIKGWKPYKDDSTGTPDEQNCIEAILQHQIRVEGERSSGLFRTIGELIDLSIKPGLSGPADQITSEIANQHLGRIGIKVGDDKLFIHNNAAGIRKILADTPWSDCWPTVLRRLPEADKEEPSRFFGHRGTHRSTSVPLSVLDREQEPDDQG